MTESGVTEDQFLVKAIVEIRDGGSGEVLVSDDFCAFVHKLNPDLAGYMARSVAEVLAKWIADLKTGELGNFEDLLRAQNAYYESEAAIQALPRFENGV